MTKKDLQRLKDFCTKQILQSHEQLIETQDVSKLGYWNGYNSASMYILKFINEVFK